MAEQLGEKVPTMEGLTEGRMVHYVFAQWRSSPCDCGEGMEH